MKVGSHILQKKKKRSKEARVPVVSSTDSQETGLSFFGATRQPFGSSAVYVKEILNRARPKPSHAEPRAELPALHLVPVIFLLRNFRKSMCSKIDKIHA